MFSILTDVEPPNLSGIISLPLTNANDGMEAPDMMAEVGLGGDCDCPAPMLGRDCCHIPNGMCNPDKVDCNLPGYLPLSPVCGCDGVTYKNFCVALFENCVKCWEYGPCSSD